MAQDRMGRRDAIYDFVAVEHERRKTLSRPVTACVSTCYGIRKIGDYSGKRLKIKPEYCIM